MKKIIYLLTISIFAFSCGEVEDVIYDNSGQTGVGFSQASANVVVQPTTGGVATLLVQATTTAAVDRSFSVAVNTDDSVGTSDNYSVGSIVIPANSYDGQLEVTFTDNSLVDFEEYLLVLDLDLPADVSVVGSKTAEIGYVKALICNDLVLTINDDRWSDERTWDVVDSTGTVVESGGPYANTPGGIQHIIPMTLADGCYTFTIYDAYADGQVDGTVTGDYSLVCSIITHASGGGNWGASEATDFCVNP